MTVDKKWPSHLSSRPILYGSLDRHGFLLAIALSILFWLIFIGGIVLLG